MQLISAALLSNEPGPHSPFSVVLHWIVLQLPRQTFLWYGVGPSIFIGVPIPDTALPRRKFNSKRGVAVNPDPSELQDLAARVRYGGNPEHKRNPGDFGLTPSAQLRPDKTACDEAGITERRVALRLLREGIRKGLVSDQVRGPGQFPQNVWAVTEDGHPLEAQLENPETGSYHGYPMPVVDPFRKLVIERWNRHEQAVQD